VKGTVKIIALLAGMVLISIAALKIPLPGDSSRIAAGQDKLSIITPHTDAIRNEFQRGFTQWYKQKTGRTVGIEYLDPGGTSDCMRFIKSEFKRSPQGIGVDMFFGGGTDPYLDLKKEGLLERVVLDSSIITPIPQNISGIDIYDKDLYWYGAVLSGFGIIYNKWVVNWLHFDVPREWKDLADPRYASWIGVADPRNSGTMHIMFEIILQAYGWEQGWKICTAIAANSRTFSKGASDVPKMVAKGDMAYGLAVDFYGWAEVAEAGEDKVGLVLPENLTVVSADAMAALKGAPHVQVAKLFTEFVLSEKGQKLWFLKKGVDGGPVVQELNRMPVRPDLYTKYSSMSNIRQDPFAVKSSFRFDHELASKRWMVVNDLFGVGLIDYNDRLQKTWLASLKAKRTDDPGWGIVPVSEDSCLALASGEWKDAVKKNSILLEWHSFYERKYKDLAGEFHVQSNR